MNKPDDKKPVTATKSRGKKKSSNDSDEKGPKPKKRKTKAEVAKEKKEKEAAAAQAENPVGIQKVPASQQPYAPPNYSMPSSMLYPNNMNIRHQMPPTTFFNQANMPNFNMNQIYRNMNPQQPPQLTPKPGSSNNSGNNLKK